MPTAQFRWQGGPEGARSIFNAETGDYIGRLGDPGVGSIADIIPNWQQWNFVDDSGNPINDIGAYTGQQLQGIAARDAANAQKGGGNQFLAIALPVALAAFGVPAGLAGMLGGGTLGAVGAGALIGAGASLLSGGNPLKGAVLGAAGGFAGGQIFGGETGAPASYMDVPDTTAAVGATANASAPVGVSTIASGGDFVNAGDVANTGVSARPADMSLIEPDATTLTAGTPASYMDTPGGIQPQVNPDGSVSWGKRIMGIINSGLQTARENKEIVGPALTGGAVLLGSVLQGQAAKEMNEKKIQSEKELLAQKTDEAARIEANKRAAIRSGSYFDAPLGFGPAGVPLRRPDGTLVYSQGLIRRSRMG